MNNILEQIDNQSQYSLARKSGISTTSINRYSQGINSITLDKLNALCESVDLRIVIKIEKNH